MSNFPVYRPSVLQELEQRSHTMPTPTSMANWSIENMPWAQQRDPVAHSQLMHFEGNSKIDESRVLLHAKRKSAIDPKIPTKQFISEEKFSAHFNSLHISNNFSHNDNSSNLDHALMESAEDLCKNTGFAHEYRVTAKELEEKLKNANSITVCGDVLKIHKEQLLVPQVLMNRIEKPCTALVLWQPPPILELLHRKNEEDLKRGQDFSKHTNKNTSPEDLIDDIEFSDAEEIDDFIDNNNTCSLDYNEVARMDEDL